MIRCKSVKLLVGVILLLTISINLYAETGINAIINESAPDFSLTDQYGNTVKLSDYKIVILEWLNPDCPYTQRHYRLNTMSQLSEKYKNQVIWLAINSTYYMDNSDNKKWVEEYKLSYPILNDSWVNWYTRVQ